MLYGDASSIEENLKRYDEFLEGWNQRQVEVFEHYEELLEQGVDFTWIREYYIHQLGEETIEKARERAGENGLDASVDSVFSKALGSVTASLYQAGSYMTGSPIDPESAWYNGTRQTTAIRQEVSEGFGDDDAAQVASLLYQIGMGVTDFAVANLATGGNGWTLVGMEAYAETGQQAVARGLSPDVIQSEAVIAAVGDMLLDKVLHTSFKGTGAVKSIFEGGLTNAGTNALNRKT